MKGSSSDTPAILENAEAVEGFSFAEFVPPPAGSLPERNGWLSPGGQFHPIARTGDHCDWCIQHTTSDCRCISNGARGCRRETSGWAKLSDGHWIIPEPHRTTQRQLDFIFDWYLRRGEQPETFCELLREMIADGAAAH